MLEVFVVDWYVIVLVLCDEFGFEQFVDLCGLDYFGYGSDEWDMVDVLFQGFSCGVEGKFVGCFVWGEFFICEISDGVQLQLILLQCFVVVVQLCFYQYNFIMCICCFVLNEELLVVVLLISVWLGLNWFECEVFDFYGVIFEGYLDLCWILIDYGFVGYLFCKDFLLIGNVEVCYDEEKKCVIYELVILVELCVGVLCVICDDVCFQIVVGESVQMEVVK